MIDMDQSNLVVLWRNCGDLPHMSVHVVPPCICPRGSTLTGPHVTPSIIVRTTTEVLGMFYSDHMGSLSGQYLPVNPKSSLIRKTIVI